MTTSTASQSGTFDIGGDLTVNRLGYGAMQLTGEGVWGEPDDPDEALRVLRRAVELGVNFIDTADSYGPDVAEELIREALHPYADDLVIATKAGLTRAGPGDWRPVGRPEYLRQQCELSLRRLGLERSTLFQLHRIDPRSRSRSRSASSRRCRSEGKIRHIGLSEVSVESCSDAQKTATIVSVQNLYNLANRDAEALLDHCDRARHRLHPLVPAGDRRARRDGGPLDGDRRGDRRHAVAARPRLAAAALAGDAADPRHVQRRAPRGQPRRRRAAS